MEAEVGEIVMCIVQNKIDLIDEASMTTLVFILYVYRHVILLNQCTYQNCINHDLIN